jgi:hypothetical protein
MKKVTTRPSIFVVCILLVLTACGGNQNTPIEQRGGEWDITSDIGDITFTVNESGTAITKAVVEYTCEVGPLLYHQTVNLDHKDDGWPIKGNKFVIDDFKKSNLEMTIKGNFNKDNTQVSGTLAVRGCSGKWASSTHSIIPTPPPGLSGIDLEPYLILPDDLPAGFSGGQVGDTLPEEFSDISSFKNVIYQQFNNNGEFVGGVTIFLFEGNYVRDLAYEDIIGGFPYGTNYSVDDVPNIGDKATFAIKEGSELNHNSISYLAFIRCHALVHISMSDISKADSVTAYATRLDERLSPLVCR